MSILPNPGSSNTFYSKGTGWERSMDKHDALPQYESTVNSCTNTFNDHSLELNISKTNELFCLDRNKAKDDRSSLFQTIFIQGQQVEQVESKFWIYTQTPSTKRPSNVSTCWENTFIIVRKEILALVYKSLVESILAVNILSWYNFLPVKDKTKLSHIVNRTSKITRLSKNTCLNCLGALWSGSPPWSHPLHHSFQLLPAGRKFLWPWKTFSRTHS